MKIGENAFTIYHIDSVIFAHSKIMNRAFKKFGNQGF